MSDHRDPSRREHFVYRAFDLDGQLLYVGCTMRLAIRNAEHRTQSQWYPLARTFKIAGPYNYDTGRRLEREAIRTESPIWNADEPRRLRINALRTRVLNRHFRIGYRSTGSTAVAYAHLDAVRDVIPEPTYDRPLTDMDVARATRAERDDALACAA